VKKIERLLDDTAIAWDGVVEILDSHGRILQTRNVTQGYGHVPARDHFQFHLDPGRYVVHLRMVRPRGFVHVRCPPSIRTDLANVHVRQSTEVVLGEWCASY
jgi:hypothetical protein